jgi:hypothetical protein
MNNNILASLEKQAGPVITDSIRQASMQTGVDFSYLMEKAAAESSFKSDIKAKTSSATGLFQFIESTWMQMVRDHGDKYGMGEMASKIDHKGRTEDPALRKEILELRKDPQKAAFMAAEFAASNKAHLERHVGGDIGTTDLYFAHFMGASGATSFLNAVKDNPLQSAAAIFPKEAAANKNVFFDSKTGTPRSLAGVYEFFDRKFKADDSAPQSPLKVQTAAAPKPSPSLYNEATFDIGDRMQDLPADQIVRKFITHPALKSILNDPDYSWSRVFASAPDDMIMSHAELLFMAQLDSPFSIQNDQNRR